ncbi:hypothetical protein [Gluconobacter albidus]|uniref:hypothetical protein n=1 Tax=Gluconobacter albidus TaxID=318683 RepID=UPI001B8B0C56|nr:hypothetical protein [Gluconobacter albidus]MBS1029108.1 hypothetical protein [Gluconobacter albidus]
MFGSDGMSGWAGYMLGQMSADSTRRRREIVDNLLRRPSESWQDKYEVLVAKAQEFLDHIRWQEGIMKERKDQIAALEADLVQVRSDLERQRALTKEWVTYADVGDRNMERLQKWADDSEVSLKQYRALYGPLPDTQKSGS